jgi:hypothetical protein
MPSRNDGDGWLTDREGNKRHFKITDQIRHRQNNFAEKFFCLQRLKFDNGVEEYRLGYYMIGKGGQER